MLPLGWIVWHLLLYAPLALGTLDVLEEDSGVTCSQGLRDCVVNDGTPFGINSVKVTDLKPQVKLCCRGNACALCLLIQVEVDLDRPGEEEGHSGLMDDEGTEETKDNDAETGSVTVCYKTPEVLPTCKKVEFTVNQARPFQPSAAQIYVILTNAVISYGSLVYVQSPNVAEMIKEFDVPSLKDVCSSDINTYIQECNVPKINVSFNEAKQVVLHFPGNINNSSVPLVCLQNETDGNCELWDGKPIPLASVTPCTCFQAWREDDQLVRSKLCPFKNTALRENIWKNLRLTVDRGSIGSYSAMLWWNVSAPCRLQGEVWACERTPGPRVCTEMKDLRKRLGEDQWSQNSKGLWEKIGTFTQINLENHPCVMIKINGTVNDLGPFCYNNINRWRWSLFAVAVMLLVSVTLLITVCLRDFIKKSMQRHLIKTHKAHVLVLSPPDSDGMVSKAVCNLGSLLCSRDFSVTVDQWSRKGQLSSGPLPWSHYQLLSTDSESERVVLVLTPKAIERAETWSCQDSPSDSPGLQEESPYSDVFRAALFAIQAYKNQGRATEHFVLVTFDSLWTDTKICHNKLPEIFWGLPLFHLPSQTKALLSDLRVGRTH